MTTSQITFPAPRTWSPLDLVTTPRLRADVSNAVAFLTQRPWFIGQATGGPSWASGSDLGFGMNAEISDPWNMHNALPGGASTSQVYAPVPGWYLCRAQIPVNWTSATAAEFAPGFQAKTGGVLGTAVHGPVYLDGTGTGITTQCLDLIEQTVPGPVGGSGDYVLPTLFVSSTVNVGNTAGNLATVSVRWAAATAGTQPLPVPPLTAVPSPITSAWLNANVRDAISFLTYPPFCKAYYVAGSGSIPVSSFSTPAVVPLNTVLADNYGGYNTATQTYTAPAAGRYLCYGQWISALTTGSWAVVAGLSVNGATQWGDALWMSTATGFSVGAQATRRVRLNKGDTVQLVAAQGSGAALPLSGLAVNQSRFIAVWEGI